MHTFYRPVGERFPYGHIMLTVEAADSLQPCVNCFFQESLTGDCKLLPVLEEAFTGSCMGSPYTIFKKSEEQDVSTN